MSRLPARWAGPLAALFLSCASACGAEALYRSNPIGMELGPLGERRAASTEWVLAVRHEGTTEIRLLTDRGKETERWEDEFDHGVLLAERVYEAGVLTAESRFRNGRLAEERDYAGGKEDSREEYRYAGGNLSSVLVFTARGALKYRERYYRGMDGRLREVVREYPDGRMSESEYTYADGRLVDEWHGSDTAGELYRYDGARLVAREDWRGAKLVDELTYERAGKDSVATETDQSDGTVTTKEYGADGNLVSEKTTAGGRVVERSDYAYLDGRLADKVVWTPGSRDESRYAYGAHGDLAKVETTHNRTLAKVTEYQSRENYVEVIYSGGQPVLRVYYKNGTKQAEVQVPAGTDASEAAQ